MTSTYFDPVTRSIQTHTPEEERRIGLIVRMIDQCPRGVSSWSVWKDNLVNICIRYKQEVAPDPLDVLTDPALEPLLIMMMTGEPAPFALPEPEVSYIHDPEEGTWTVSISTTPFP